MESIREEQSEDQPYALVFPTDIYSKEEQEYIFTLNELRKDLEAEKHQHGKLPPGKTKKLAALRWVLRLIDEITQD